MKLHQRENKLGNAKRAFASALQSYKGGLGFRQTAFGQHLTARVKRWASRIAAAVLLSLPVIHAQTNTLKDRFLELGTGVSETKAVSVALYPGYAPDLKLGGVSKPWGGGVAVLYPVFEQGGEGFLSGFVGGRLDYLADKFWAPSATVGLQAKLRIYGVETTPFVIGGAIFPLGGAGDQNGEVGAIVGGGLSVNVLKFGKQADGSYHGKLSLFYATEKWSNFDGIIHRPGVNISYRIW